ncbi:DegT/DnrJ/EryC1/StrS family aminotransferase [Calidithermus chliarophilus]|uniref:DegT/DnrJ/EryC1/StrS family aminotransferase n=1 Tax=Calidithermus chliarophilus TaxID=52023 RepID=UPI00042A121B|nr:DegT/DnrJ/EryC1/StrS family aminotransferase [Calidithermus chliarophilus]
MVPIIDLQSEYRLLKPDIDAALERVLASGAFVGGPEVAALERELSEYLGVPHVVGVGSGTDALFIALRALGVGPGDEVVTTPFTFVATVEAILIAGARPVLVDIDPRTFNLDPELLEAAVTERTRAVLPVHLYGQVAPMAEIRAVAERHGLKILEDAAQAIGARYCEAGGAGGAMAGTLGHAAGFSLYPTKNLGAYGDGGFITTADAAVAEEARLLASHGSKVRYHHVRAAGYTSRLDGVQAAILRVKLPHLEGWNRRRREIARRYDEGLRGAVQTPTPPPYARHVYHQYTVRAPERDRLQAFLKERGVASSVHYPLPVHLQPAYRDLAPEGSLPHAEQAAREVLSLPMHPFLTDAQVEAVIEAVRAYSS